MKCADFYFDLESAWATYNEKCFYNFECVNIVVGRHLDETNVIVMEEIIRYFKNNNDSQFTLAEL